MPDRLQSIETVLDEVEQKGALFLERLADSGAFEIEVGSLKILQAGDGRPYFLRQPGGLPVWPDVRLIAPGQEIGVNLAFPEYDLAYARLKDRQLEANSLNQTLDLSDALEALVLAELVRDTVASESLIFRMSKQFAGTTSALEKLAGRGNTRIRSVLGRVLVLVDSEESWKLLQQTLADEPAEGVRADIICTAIVKNGLRSGGISLDLLGEWLAGELLVDPLSCLVSLGDQVRNLPVELWDRIRPEHRPRLAAWLEKRS